MLIRMLDWSPLILTFKLAVVTTLILLILIAIPLAFWLSRSRSRRQACYRDTCQHAPGTPAHRAWDFTFLVAFSPGNAFGAWLNEWLGIKLLFSFPGTCGGFCDLQPPIYGTSYPIRLDPAYRQFAF